MQSSSIQQISEHFQEAINIHELSLESLAAPLFTAGEILTSQLLEGGKIMVCGDGESMLEATGLSTILLNRLDRERPGLPIVTLNADTSTITAISRDYQHDQIFSRQIHALANDNDVLVIFSTSGQSSEICRAIEAAHQYTLPILLFSGVDGGQAALLLEEDDCELRVPSKQHCRIREMHLLLVHCLCQHIDTTIFG